MWLPRKARTLGNELKLEWKSTAHSQMCARKLMCLSFLQIHLNLIANYHFTGSKKKNSVSFPQATFPPSIYTGCVEVSGTQGQVPLPRVHPAWDAGQHHPLVRTEVMSAWGTRPSLSGLITLQSAVQTCGMGLHQVMTPKLSMPSLLSGLPLHLSVHPTSSV